MSTTEKLPAGIRLTKSGRYEARPYDRRLKKKGKAVLFDSLEDAAQYLEDTKHRRIDPSKAGWTVRSWAEEWMTNPGYQRPKASTNAHNHERVSKFVEEHGDDLMTEITRPIARRWAAENPSRLGAVRAMFSDALNDEVVQTNPFTQLRQSKGSGRKHLDVPTQQEVQALIDIAYEKWPDWPFFGSYIATAAYTGLRIGELLALRWEDINWEQGTISVERQWNSKIRDYDTLKNGRPRTIVLFEQAADALRILPKDGPDGLIWRSPRGARIEPNLHFYYWAQVRERWFGTLSQERFNKLKELDFHTLRHFHASWLVDMGVPPADVAAQLGHTDGGYLVQTLYGHLYEDNSLARIKKVVSEARLAS